ncbi:hypothetical protein N657DRAFT_673667 [Parathielavia appendiculata]|uniref:methionyl-tRNA formyltransferase n=1 Tax=Parathielavia appendiculata TaxID=2587402 RepID=A0AAN6TVE1_9PEZI|nr:hypothetical protein N657DRAFT_673667 [Parathielavia appendiculata]
MGLLPATPAPSRFLMSKKPSTQNAQSQTPNAQYVRVPSQFNATPRFTATTRPSSTQPGRAFTTPALAIKPRVLKNRSTQDIINDSSPVSPEEGSPPASPTTRDALPEPIEFDSSLVPQSPSPSALKEGRSPKRRRISIASSEPETNLIEPSQQLQETDLDSLPDAPDHGIAAYHSDVDVSGNDVDDDDDDDGDANNSSTHNLNHSSKLRFSHQIPRFKPTEPPDRRPNYPDATNAYLTADIFSPQRRGNKYLPGGLAAELRDWLVDVKGGVDGGGKMATTCSALRFASSSSSSAGNVAAAARIAVEELSRGGAGMTLVAGRQVPMGKEQGAGLEGRLAWFLRSGARQARWRFSYGTSTASKKSDPLRILFCGSDDFSCHSLGALHDEQKRNANLIRSIDVVVRPSKPTGRGHKVIREVPARKLAEELKLPIHVRDTFTGWDLPKPDDDPINLIVAVSFGLFVPPRLINATKYGGLNVHPSLLPEFRGPAPLHHALLANRSHTGITIQTLSPHAFDEGIPLLQTPLPGIPIPPNCTLPQLHAILAPRGADMLLQTLRRGLHVPPHKPFPGCTQYPYPPRSSNAVPDAPKITAADREVRWDDVAGAGEVVRRARVLGSLWTYIRASAPGALKKRAILDELSEVSAEEIGGEPTIRPGETPDVGGVQYVMHGEVGEIAGRLWWHWAGAEGGKVLVRMRDGTWLSIGKIKLEGSVFKPAWSVLSHDIVIAAAANRKHGQ